MNLRHVLTGIALAAGLLSSACAQTGGHALETVVIDPDAPRLTMINVLTPEPGKQADVVAALNDGLGAQVANMPGFISATIHKSLDNEYVVVYAQWRDQAAVDEAVKRIQTGGAPSMMTAFTIASPEFHPYDVIAVHKAKGADQ